MFGLHVRLPGPCGACRIFRQWTTDRHSNHRTSPCGVGVPPLGARLRSCEPDTRLASPATGFVISGFRSRLRSIAFHPWRPPIPAVLRLRSSGQRLQRSRLTNCGRLRCQCAGDGFRASTTWMRREPAAPMFDERTAGNGLHSRVPT